MGLLTQTNRLKLSAAEFNVLKALCRLSKNLYNVTLYTVRQHFFQTQAFLKYEAAYHLCKANENYLFLAKDVAQQTMKYVERSFFSFFELLKLKQAGQYSPEVKLPQYLDKEGYFPVVIPIRPRDQQRMKQTDWHFTLPMSPAFRETHGSIRIFIPERLREKRIREIRIVPQYEGRIFEVAYVYEEDFNTLAREQGRILSLDLGVNNLVSAVSSAGESFLISGKPLKSINQWFNKRQAYLQSIKDKQGIQGLTAQQSRLLFKRKQQVKDYLNKTARVVVDYCKSQGIGQLIVGNTPGIKQELKLGTRNNQIFIQIPWNMLKKKLEELCVREGIKYVEQEESYTSQGSALDGDILPVYGEIEQKPSFSGKRVKRGLYKTGEGWLVNADCNGALNILRKYLSKQNEPMLGLSRGCLAQPRKLYIS